MTDITKREFHDAGGLEDAQNALARATRHPVHVDLGVTYDETDLDRSEVHSKQLAHNALDWHDDPQVAQEIFDRIDDVTERIKSGVQEADFDLDFEPVEVDPIEVDFDQEIVNLVFLPRQYEDFDDLVSTLNDESEIYLADLEDFPDFQAIARDVSERYDIHSMPAIVHRIVEICLHWLKNHPPDEDPEAVIDSWDEVDAD